jgi:hypothetical protein
MSLRTLMQAGPAKANDLFARLLETSDGAVTAGRQPFAEDPETCTFQCASCGAAIPSTANGFPKRRHSQRRVGRQSSEGLALWFAPPRRKPSSASFVRSSLLSLIASPTNSFVSAFRLRIGKRCCSSRLVWSSSSPFSGFAATLNNNATAQSPAGAISGELAVVGGGSTAGT